VCNDCLWVVETSGMALRQLWSGAWERKAWGWIWGGTSTVCGSLGGVGVASGVLSEGEMESRAIDAADCSASFLVGKEPREEKSWPVTVTVQVKEGQCDGPSVFVLYTGNANPFPCTNS
jgi:hypothetical protein